jgi:hypothetical protein
MMPKLTDTWTAIAGLLDPPVCAEDREISSLLRVRNALAHAIATPDQNGKN